MSGLCFEVGKVRAIDWEEMNMTFVPAAARELPQNTITDIPNIGHADIHTLNTRSKSQ